MKYLVSLLFFCTFVSFAQPQRTGVYIEKPEHDFGTVAEWNNPVAVFTLTNNTPQTINMMPGSPQPDVYIVLPQGIIQPFQTKQIQVFYFTSKTGRFKREIPLYVTNQKEPLQITIKGDVTSFGPRAQKLRPGWSEVPDSTKTYDEFQILIVDHYTNEPLPGVSVMLISKNSTVPGVKTTSDAGIIKEKLPVGPYDLVLKKEGYHTTYKEIYLMPKQGIISADMYPDPTFKVSFKEDKNTPTKATPKVAELDKNLYLPNNVVLLLDVSSSMKENNKLAQVKSCVKQLAGAYRDIDYLTIMTYNTRDSLLLPTTIGQEKAIINYLVDQLEPNGTTNGLKGLKKAYEIAEDNLISNGNNQVIIATDGMFNGPGFSESVMLNLVEKYKEKKIKLSVMAFGKDKEGIRVMKKMSDAGNGNFIRIESGNDNEALLEEIKLMSLIK